MLAYEVPFLELDGDEDVRRGRDREEHVREVIVGVIQNAKNQPT